MRSGWCIITAGGRAGQPERLAFDRPASPNPWFWDMDMRDPNPWFWDMDMRDPNPWFWDMDIRDPSRFP